ncbi:MAG: hypothetical protein NTY77_01385 [Elusimicrobia bacterium]|nr:hypothetical protein [Elusimicrobiota bacterium]
MRFVLVLLAAALPVRFAAAQETLGSQGFGYLGFQQLRQMLPAGAPSVPGRAVGLTLTVPEKVTDSYLLPRAGKQSLYSYPKNAAENQAFLDKWTKILGRAGFTPGANDYEENIISVLPYTGSDGLVIREFMAEPMQFKPKDPADLLANMEKISDAVKAAGLPIIASFTSDFEFYLPTYHLYYLTKGNAKANEEVQVRILKAEGVDAKILEKAGIQVLQQAKDYSNTIDIITVYIGREVGLVTRSADKREDLDTRIADFKKFIAEQGGGFIEAVVRELPPGSYRNFEADLYFFQAGDK